MNRTPPIFLLIAFLIGCSSAHDFRGYDSKSGDLGAFILQQAPKFGAHIQQSSGLPEFTAAWRYKEDADGFQIYIAGDRLTQLQSFLVSAFGPSARPLTTNEMGGTQHVGTYYGPELGVALTYGWDTTRDGKQFTSMVVVRKSALP